MTIFTYRHKPKLEGLFQALLQRAEVTNELLDKLDALIQEKRKQL